jgi:hypothetical protein
MMTNNDDPRLLLVPRLCKMTWAAPAGAHQQTLPAAGDGSSGGIEPADVACGVGGLDSESD